MFEREKTTKRRLPSSNRHGGTTGVVITILIVAAIIGGVAYYRVHNAKAGKVVNLIYATAERGTFVHEVNGKGSAESAKNVDVASQVEGSATVIYLIPEGSDVKKGDLLVELDSSDVDEKLDSQVVTTNTSRATLNSSRATLRSAEISLEEYVEGTFEQSWMEYESSIFDAEQTRKQKADITRFTERLLNLDYSTELQYEIDKVAEENAKNTLDVTNLKKMTLLKYTSEKQITSLMSDIETARAKVDSDKNSYNINLNRENRYRAQSANCKIKAPQDGQVVYANQDSRRMSESDMIKEGSSVRQRQVLIRLPDKSQMQVKTMINESNISSVKVGMPAKITFDSMPDHVVEGEVTKVNLYPEIVWMSSAKDYVTLVKIKEDVPELRSGLTAQVRIIADEQENVLMVPVQCVTEFGKKDYCITYKDGVWGYKEVLLGASNEKQVIILDGLNEGDVVVSGARLYREKVEFPPVDEPSKFENSEVYQQKIAAMEAEEEKQKDIEASNPEGGAMQAGGPAGGMPSADGAPNGGGFAGAGGGIPGAGGAPNGGGFAGAGGAPNGGGLPGAGGVPGGLPEGVDLAKLAAMFGKGGGAGHGGSLDDDPEAQQEREDQAVVYNKDIEERLAHDVQVAAIQPFFSRTVMEMQRELLSAISDKTKKLQSRIATRQNEITRRQEEIELLEKASAGNTDAAEDVDDSDDDATAAVVNTGESSEQKIERLKNEIKTLRGSSDVDPMEHVSYVEQIDWTKYVSGNNITKDGLDFLLEDSDKIFDEMFPDSQELSVSSTAKTDSAEDEEEFQLLKKEDDSLYGAFKGLFEGWDTNANDVLTPTEFVIGFFTDRKSFQDSETDADIDKLFAEYCPEDSDSEVNEVSFDNVELVANKILSERSEAVKGGSGRGGKGRGGRGQGGRAQGGFPGGQGQGGFPGGMAGGQGQGGFPGGMAGGQGQGGFPGGMAGGPAGAQGQGGFPGGPAGAQGQGAPNDAAADAMGQGGLRPGPDGESVDSNGESGDGAPAANEPIKSLAEANSLRQAIAFYVMQMDFNDDGVLQKSEFVKGYNDVNDVAGKMFASVSANNGDSGGDGGRGMGPMGPPPM